eukprot:403346271
MNYQGLLQRANSRHYEGVSSFTSNLETRETQTLSGLQKLGHKRINTALVNSEGQERLIVGGLQQHNQDFQRSIAHKTNNNNASLQIALANPYSLSLLNNYSPQGQLQTDCNPEEIILKKSILENERAEIYRKLKYNALELNENKRQMSRLDQRSQGTGSLQNGNNQLQQKLQSNIQTLSQIKLALHKDRNYMNQKYDSLDELNIQNLNIKERQKEQSDQRETLALISKKTQTKISYIGDSQVNERQKQERLKNDSNSIRYLICKDNKDEKQMVEKSQNHLSSKKSLFLENEKIIQTRSPQEKHSFLEYEHQTSMRSMDFQKRNKAEVPLKFRKQNTHLVKNLNSSLGLNSQDELPSLVDHQTQLKQLYQQLESNTVLRDQYFQELEMKGQNMQQLSRDIQHQHKTLKSIQDKREAITLIRSGAHNANPQISQKYDQQSQGNN